MKLFTLRWSELGPADALALSLSVALVLANVIAPSAAPADSLTRLSNVPIGMLAAIGAAVSMRRFAAFFLRLARRRHTKVQDEPLSNAEATRAFVATVISAWLYWSVAPSRDDWVLASLLAISGSVALVSPIRRWRQGRTRP